VQEETEMERMAKVKYGDTWVRTLMLTNPITFPIVIFRELFLRMIAPASNN